MLAEVDWRDIISVIGVAITGIGGAILTMYFVFRKRRIDMNKEEYAAEQEKRAAESKADQDRQTADEQRMKDRFAYHLGLFETRINDAFKRLDDSQKAHIQCEEERAAATGRLCAAEEKIERLEAEIVRIKAERSNRGGR
jgi:hypothetical protein